MPIAHNLIKLSIVSGFLVSGAILFADDAAVIAAVHSKDLTRLTAATLEGGSPNAYDDKGRSALWIARWESYDCFRHLLSLGADPNAPALRGGGTLLGDLVGVNAIRYLRTFHEFGGILDAQVENANGEREHFLIRLVRLGEVDSIFYVLSHGVSRFVKDSNGRTPLQVAIDLRRFQVAYFLLSRDVYDPASDSEPERFLRLREEESLKSLKAISLYWREKVVRELSQRWGTQE